MEYSKQITRIEERNKDKEKYTHALLMTCEHYRHVIIKVEQCRWGERTMLQHSLYNLLAFA